MTITSDQRASIRAVIAAEQRTIAHYTALLTTDPRATLAHRWRGLKAYHQRKVREWRKELRGR